MTPLPLQHLPNCQSDSASLYKHLSLRQVVVSAAGYTLVRGKYVCLELRMVAHLSKDVRLMAALTAKVDFYEGVAALLFKQQQDRQTVKQTVHAILYGISAASLSVALCVTKTEAADVVAAFASLFPQLHTYLQEVRDAACASGSVRTIGGRVRRIPGLFKSGGAQAQAMRVALRMFSLCH